MFYKTYFRRVSELKNKLEINGSKEIIIIGLTPWFANIIPNENVRKEKYTTVYNKEGIEVHLNRYLTPFKKSEQMLEDPEFFTKIMKYSYFKNFIKHLLMKNDKENSDIIFVDLAKEGKLRDAFSTFLYEKFKITCNEYIPSEQMQTPKKIVPEQKTLFDFVEEEKPPTSIECIFPCQAITYLRNLAIRSKISVEKLADECGVSVREISMFFEGTSNDAALLFSIARKMKVSVILKKQ